MSAGFRHRDIRSPATHPPGTNPAGPNSSVLISLGLLGRNKDTIVAVVSVLTFTNTYSTLAIKTMFRQATQRTILFSLRASRGYASAARDAITAAKPDDVVITVRTEPSVLRPVVGDA